MLLPTSLYVSDKAINALAIAKAIAEHNGDEEVTTEHLLIAIACTVPPLGCGGAAIDDLKGKMPMTFEGINAPEECFTSRLKRDQIAEVKCSDELQQILNAAPAEAEKLNYDYVGTEHLLLAILASPSTARDRLHSVGITYENGRRQVVHLLKTATM